MVIVVVVVVVTLKVVTCRIMSSPALQCHSYPGAFLVVAGRSSTCMSCGLPQMQQKTGSELDSIAC